MSMKRRVFQLIDLDRTIFDTARFAIALTEEIEATEPGVGAELEARFEAAYANEETFFMLRFLRESRGDAWFEALVQRVVSVIGGESLLLPGVKERLELADELSDVRPSWGVLTYGDEVDQLMKLRLIGLEGAAVVVSHTPDKGELLKSWQQADGTFILPQAFGGGSVECLTLEDDKLRAFHNLPAGVRGFWVMAGSYAPERLEAAQKDGVSDAVMAVRDLSDASSYLKGLC